MAGVFKFLRKAVAGELDPTSGDSAPPPHSVFTQGGRSTRTNASFGRQGTNTRATNNARAPSPSVAQREYALPSTATNPPRNQMAGAGGGITAPSATTNRRRDITDSGSHADHSNGHYSAYSGTGLSGYGMGSSLGGGSNSGMYGMGTELNRATVSYDATPPAPVTDAASANPVNTVLPPIDGRPNATNKKPWQTNTNGQRRLSKEDSDPFASPFSVLARKPVTRREMRPSQEVEPSAPASPALPPPPPPASAPPTQYSTVTATASNAMGALIDEYDMGIDGFSSPFSVFSRPATGADTTAAGNGLPTLAPGTAASSKDAGPSALDHIVTAPLSPPPPTATAAPASTANGWGSGDAGGAVSSGGLSGIFGPFGDWGADLDMNAGTALAATRLNRPSNTNTNTNTATTQQQNEANRKTPSRNSSSTRSRSRSSLTARWEMQKKANSANRDAQRPAVGSSLRKKSSSAHEDNIKAAAVARWTEVANVAEKQAGLIRRKISAALTDGNEGDQKPVDNDGGDGAASDTDVGTLRRLNRLAPSKWNKVREFGQRLAEAQQTRIREGRSKVRAGFDPATLTDGTLAVFSALPATRRKKPKETKEPLGDYGEVAHSHPQHRPPVEGGARDDSGYESGTYDGGDGCSSTEMDDVLPLTMSALWDDNVSLDNSLQGSDTDDEAADYAQAAPMTSEEEGEEDPYPNDGDNRSSVMPTGPGYDNAMALPSVGYHAQHQRRPGDAPRYPAPPHQRPQRPPHLRQQNLWAQNAAVAAAAAAAGQATSPGAVGAVPHGRPYPREYHSAPPQAMNTSLSLSSQSTQQPMARSAVMLGPGANEALHAANPRFRKNTALRNKMPGSNVLFPQPNIFGPPLRPLPKPTVAQAFDYDLRDVAWVHSPNWDALRVGDRQRAMARGGRP